MHAFFAILLLVHVISASTAEKAVPDSDKAAAAVSLNNLCIARKGKGYYEAIRTKMSKSPYDRDGVIKCIKIFCRSNDVNGLEAIHSISKTKGKYSRFGLLRATASGSVDAIKFYAERADIDGDDLLENAKEAAKKGHLGAVSYFLPHEKFPHFDSSKRSVLLEAVEAGHMDIVSWILGKCMTLSQSDLYIVALTAHGKSHWDIIGVLTKHGFDINDDELGFNMPKIRSAYSAWKVYDARKETLEHLC